MAFIAAAAIGAGGSLLGGLFGSSAAKKAAKAQAAAARYAADLEQKRFQETRADLAPYRNVGGPAVGRYADWMGLNGPEAQAAARNAFQTDPGYEFAFDEGRRAVEGSAAAGPMGIGGGGVLKALTRYGQGQANQQVGSYLDRFMNLANIGQNAAAQTGNFGSISAGRQGQYALDAGAARAGGYLGQANAYSGAISGGLQVLGQGIGRGWFDPTPNPYIGGRTASGDAYRILTGG